MSDKFGHVWTEEDQHRASEAMWRKNISYGPPVYIPHLRRRVRPWRDITDYPYVPLTDEEETEGARALRLRVLEHVMRYGHQFWLTIPMAEEASYPDYHQDVQLLWLRDMAQDGQWDLAWDSAKGGTNFRLLPPVKRFRQGEFQTNAVMAHVMHKAKFFPSVAEARRNGWNQPIVPGLYLFGVEKHRIEIVSDSPPRASLQSTTITLTFTEGEPLSFTIADDPDPVADWSCWCQEWDGERYNRHWQHFEQCRRSEALAKSPTILYAIRREPTWVSAGPGQPATKMTDKLRIEIVMPQINRNSRDYWTLANQVEQSNASIHGRRVRKIEHLHIRST